MNASLEERVLQSARLHRRVREFASHEIERFGVQAFSHAASSCSEPFVDLACGIASFQVGRRLESLEEVVSNAVPADCFKFGHIFRFPVATAACSFRTSGTTANNTGVHLMREPTTYEHLSLLWGNVALGLDETPTPLIVALAPWTGRNTASSLGYMMQRMMERFDGKSVSQERLATAFSLDDPLRWLVCEQGVDIDGLSRVAELAKGIGTRVVLLATSFALVEMLDALGTAAMELPSGSTVMPTGGFKGRTRTIAPDVMAKELRRVFGDVDLVGEYGMTELSSQLYEPTGRWGKLQGEAGVYVEPPWLKVVPCCPQTLKPVPEGDVGLACFVDLGNVDSAVALLTQDLVCRENNGIRLLGRRPSAPLRGCSLAIEALLQPRTGAGTPSVTQAVTLDNTERAPALEVHARHRVLSLIEGAQRCKQALLDDLFCLTELAHASFMSVPGAKLALELALETHPPGDDIDTLITAARAKARLSHETEAAVWVVLSATVFTAAHRAVALALSISPRVKLKPSRRQPHFARALAKACDGLFELVDEIAPVRGDLVMVFGSDETVDVLRKTLPSGVTLQAFGHGMGVALVGAGADLQSSAEALALDMLLFEQQGCLSPRVVLVDTACDVRAFSSHLSWALSSRSEAVPPGMPAPEHVAHAAWEQRVATTLATAVVPHATGWIAEYDAAWCQEHRLPLSTTPRTISLVGTSEPLLLLASLASTVTCVGFVGGPSLAADLERALPNARRVPLGTMQRPRFDGPVDLRVT